MNLLASLLTPLLRFAARKNLPNAGARSNFPVSGQDVGSAGPLSPSRSGPERPVAKPTCFVAQGYVPPKTGCGDGPHRPFLAERCRMARTLRGEPPLPRAISRGTCAPAPWRASTTSYGCGHPAHQSALIPALLSERSAVGGGLLRRCDATGQAPAPPAGGVPDAALPPAPWNGGLPHPAKGFSLMLSSALVTRPPF